MQIVPKQIDIRTTQANFTRSDQIKSTEHMRQSAPHGFVQLKRSGDHHNLSSRFYQEFCGSGSKGKIKNAKRVIHDPR
jgi:hypothetical protein